MRAYLSFLFFICSFLFSCNNNDIKEESSVEQIQGADSQMDSEQTPENEFLTNSEVESLIDANEPLFLSAFWIGMTKEESIQIIRFLLDKQEISGIIYSFSSSDYEELGTKKLKNTEFDQDKIRLHCLLTPKNKTLKCDVDLNFNEINGENILESIHISATSQVKLIDFENFIDLTQDLPINGNTVKFIDLGSDNRHPGPQQHQQYAEKIFNLIKESNHGKTI